jgi:hypothetical protein
MPSEITTSDEIIEVQAETPLVAVNAEDEVLVNKMPSTESSTENKWQPFGEKTSVFIDSLPTYIADFFNKYNQLLVTLGWILAAFATVKLTLALLDAINDIPLLPLMLELVGLGYTTWFVFRYLLSAASRQELTESVKTLKEQFLGI